MQFLRRARSGTLQLGGGPAYGIQHSAEEDVLFRSESTLVFKLHGSAYLILSLVRCQLI